MVLRKRVRQRLTGVFDAKAPVRTFNSRRGGWWGDRVFTVNRRPPKGASCTRDAPLVGPEVVKIDHPTTPPGVKLFKTRVSVKVSVVEIYRSRWRSRGVECSIYRVGSRTFRWSVGFLPLTPPVSVVSWVVAVWSADLVLVFCRGGTRVRFVCFGGFNMPALAPYIPARDANLANFVDNFSALITATPALYGLGALDAANIAAVVSAWDSAFALVTSPATKTAAVVSAKNAAKVSLLQTIRPYAQTIALNPGVASADKIALGLNPRTSPPSPISAPNSSPVLVVQSGSNLAIVVRYRDSAAAVSVKGKPYGVISCEVYGLVSETAVSDVEVLAHVVSATKSPFVLQRGAADGGKQIYLAARWKTRTGLYSPWSGIISFTVPIGG